MHVMETDCEKVGGGCLTAESAPELAKPSESPLLVTDDKSDQHEKDLLEKDLEVNDVNVNEEKLVNGDSEHIDGDVKKADEEPAADGCNDEEMAAVVAEVEDDKMEIVDSSNDNDDDKGTKDDDAEVLNDDIEMRGSDSEEVEESATEPVVKESDAVETVDDKEEAIHEQPSENELVVNIEKPVQIVAENEAIAEMENEEAESDEIKTELVEEIKTGTVDDASSNVVKTKEPTEEDANIETEVAEEESSSVVVLTEKETEKKTSVAEINGDNEEKKPASPPVSEPSQSAEVEDEVMEIPVTVSEGPKPNGHQPVKLISKEVEKRKSPSDKEGEAEVSSGSESDSSRKKIKVEPDLETATHSVPTPSRPDHPVHERSQKHLVDDDRERFIQEFISQCSQSVEEMDRASERLNKELETLAELAKAKELEWNAIIRVRKMREEILERLLRKRRLATDEYLERTHSEHNSLHKNAAKYHGSNQLMMVPIVSSSPGIATSHRGPPPVRLAPVDYGKLQRPILPKPCLNVNTGMVDPNCNPREGRNGPTVDVKSIIADYRSRHPENVPRRGRRLRGGPLPPDQPPSRMSANPSLISMANMALGSGASIRTVSDAPYNLSQDHSRPSSTDPARSVTVDPNSMAYKDAVLQFAKYANQVGVGHVGKGPPNGAPPAPPPPYPEVTLHPVSRSGSSPPTPPTSSLLHGILTKSSNTMGAAAAAAAAAVAASGVRPPANFSPTLARLLTAPDRPPMSVQPPPHFRPQHPPRVSIADILSSSKKSRNEITITPVSGNPSAKTKDDAVLMQDEDEVDVSDRLVIDENADNEEVPQCQGCRQKPAQFVCAGCGNQWYCSRECQVTAWEDHSDVCSG